MKKRTIAVLVLLAVPWNLHHRPPQQMMGDSDATVRLDRVTWFFHSFSGLPISGLADPREIPTLQIPLNGDTATSISSKTVIGDPANAPVRPSGSAGIFGDILDGYAARVP
jgi:hypothetical protein